MARAKNVNVLQGENHPAWWLTISACSVCIPVQFSSVAREQSTMPSHTYSFGMQGISLSPITTPNAQ